MPYKPTELPFIGYKEKVRELKRLHDRLGCAYPLTIEVHDGQQMLITQTFAYNNDRKSKPEVVALDDWSPPLTVKVLRKDGTSDEISVEEVRVPDASNDSYQPPISAELLAEVKEYHRQNAADLQRRKKEIEGGK